eukprot:364215-Chlamydomonas_euryale.AAC.4
MCNLSASTAHTARCALRAQLRWRRDVRSQIVKPGMGKPAANASTRERMSATLGLASSAATKSFSALPLSACSSLHSDSTSSKNSPMRSKSASRSPRLVIAGAPMRTPPGANADTSPMTVFLLRVMWHMSHAFSILEPVTPSGRRSHRTKWFSVPPVTSVPPAVMSALASAAELATTCFWYATNSGDIACLSATASAPI